MPDKKFGRISPRILPKNNPAILQFGAYLKPLLRPAPMSVDWSKNLNYPMDLNDQIGDCAIAAVAHQIQCWSAHTQVSPVILDNGTVLSVYEAVSGYNPSQASTDQGCVLSDVYSYWKNTGVSGNKISAAVSIDPQITNNVKWGINIFGGCALGLNLPQSAIDQTDANEMWTVETGRESKIVGGHCVECYGYTPTYLIGTSWGQPVDISWAFLAKYCEELWAFVDPYWFDSVGISPTGLNFASLMTDANLI